jgi:hypothetical protein
VLVSSTITKEVSFTKQVNATTLGATTYGFTADSGTSFYTTQPNVLTTYVGGKQRQVISGENIDFFAQGVFYSSDAPDRPIMAVINSNFDKTSAYIRMSKLPTGRAVPSPCPLGEVQYIGKSGDFAERLGVILKATCDSHATSKIEASFSIYTAGEPSIGTTGVGERLRISGNGTATFTGGIVGQGAANTFAQASINSTAIGPLQLKTIGVVGSYTMVIDDAGKLLWNTYTGGDSIISIPTNATCPFPIGTVVDVLDASTAATRIQGSSGVTLNFTTNHLVDPGVLDGGVGTAGRCRMKGILSTVRLLKIGTDHWYVLGDVSKT